VLTPRLVSSLSYEQEDGVSWNIGKEIHECGRKELMDGHGGTDI
jgi:hypothetical protein